jgi:hypothetical protein
MTIRTAIAPPAPTPLGACPARRAELAKFRVSAKEHQELLEIVGKTKTDIVAPAGAKG